MSTPWQAPTAGSPAASGTPAARPRPNRRSIALSGRLSRAWPRIVAAPCPELAALIALAGALNLWALTRNGWANDYYSAAVRSMSSSWHNFLFASLDHSGVMTVDKPPLALWVQALSVRLFGYHPLSVLVPQALMGIASVVLVYDLVRRRFGRFGGFVAGLALAVTPIAVAVSRHNNPDALLMLCCVAAIWFAARALEERRSRWLVLSGVCVGLAFETKMLVAMVVVPGIAAAWLLLAPRGRPRLRALRQLLAAGTATVLVGGAWPALVELTPASERPWVAGTSDNSALSLIFGYNGLGRVEGQAGGPGGLGASQFGSTPGPFRLLNSALGGQAGWLLGFALLSALAMLASTRLRRSDPRSGWLLAVGGAFVTTAVLFSAASGIFHPYYVSLLAPFAAALAGAGAAELARGGLNTRLVGPLAIAAGVATELIVLGDYPGQLSWLPVVLTVLGAISALALVLLFGARVRLAAVTAAVAALLVAPSVWAVDTLGYAASETFPAGGPASAQGGIGPFGRLGGFGPRPGFGRSRAKLAGPGARQLFGPGGPGQAPGRALPGASPPGGLAREGGPPPGAQGAGGQGVPGGFAGGPFGNDRSLTPVLAYIRRHGGGTLAVSSQSSAAPSIIAQNADVAAIGGFSGRESTVSVSWLAQEVRSGKIRWVLGEQGAPGGGPGLREDTRAGSKTAMAAVAQACRAVSLPASTAAGTASGATGADLGATAIAAGGATATGTLYDCQGRASQLSAITGS